MPRRPEEEMAVVVVLVGFTNQLGSPLVGAQIQLSLEQVDLAGRLTQVVTMVLVQRMQMLELQPMEEAAAGKEMLAVQV